MNKVKGTALVTFEDGTEQTINYFYKLKFIDWAYGFGETDAIKKVKKYLEKKGITNIKTIKILT